MTERNPHRVKSIEVIEAMHRAFMRIKHLKLEKVIVMFFKSIAEYKEQVRKIYKRKTKYTKEKSSEHIVAD